MKKAPILSVLLLLITIFTSAQASPTRSTAVYPALSFNGTTVNCSAYIGADTPDGAISATIQLWQGSTCIATWYASGIESLTYSASKTVTSGLQYTLTVDATVNGYKLSRVSTTRTCP